MLLSRPKLSFSRGIVNFMSKCRKLSTVMGGGSKARRVQKHATNLSRHLSPVFILFHKYRTEMKSYDNVLKNLMFHPTIQDSMLIANQFSYFKAFLLY